MNFRRLLYLALALFAFAIYNESFACSGYKITVGQKTIFGSNEDAWRLSPRIWFEKAIKTGTYGAVFTGSRFDGKNGYAPQSGMNEHGLAFERLVAHHPNKGPIPNKKSIDNPTKYLKEIIHTCKSVDDVAAFIQQYDHSYFLGDVFVYIDKSGKYLVVEPYSLTKGSDSAYVFSNFCPSITSKETANGLNRYRKGSAFIKHGIDTSLAFCTALSDTMHVCRSKIGDGTLLTSIWDLNEGTVNLYFYHTYDSTIQFKLSNELRKGNHILSIDSMFPRNVEFESLRTYQTPSNTSWMALFLVGCAGLFLVSSIYFLVKFFQKKLDVYNLWLMVPLGLAMSFYMYVLMSSIGVFYFSAPYKDPTSVLISGTSYLPFVVLGMMIPMVLSGIKLIQLKHSSRFTTGIFIANTVTYGMLIALFVYWDFYTVL